MSGTPAVAEGLAGLLLRIDHVGFAVADLDEAIALWERLGLVRVHEEVNEEQGVREAMLAVGQSSGRVQLLAPLRPDSAIASWLERRGPGIQQVAFTVTSADEATAALRAAGLRVLYDEPRRGTAGSRINFIHPKDCGGVLVEIVEPLVGNHP